MSPPQQPPTTDAERPTTADDARGDLLPTLSHDLRTPLAAILGLAATLERQDIELDADETRDIARRIGANARRLDRMVDDLVDLDELGGDVAPPSLVATDIGALVSEVIASAEWLEGYQVDVDVVSARADVDRPKIQRVVERLLENAVRHSPETSRVRVRVERGEVDVVIVVEDDGPDVPVADRERVFRATASVDDSPRRSAGMGIALALVARIAEIHGGRAWVQDREGGGASFRVGLPIAGSVAT